MNNSRVTFLGKAQEALGLRSPDALLQEWNAPIEGHDMEQIPDTHVLSIPCSSQEMRNRVRFFPL